MSIIKNLLHQTLQTLPEQDLFSPASLAAFADRQGLLKVKGILKPAQARAFDAYRHRVGSLDEASLWAYAASQRLPVGPLETVLERVRHQKQQLRIKASGLLERHGLLHLPEGTLLLDGCPLSAWYGRTWRRLWQEELELSEHQGRPLKYVCYLKLLNEEDVYSAGSVVQLGFAHGLVEPGLSREAKKNYQIKVRHALSHLTVRHGFPNEGDGWVRLKGQPPTVAWYGARWQAAMWGKPKDSEGEGALMGKKDPRGRKRKYQAFLECLKDDECYSPAMVVAEGKRAGLFLMGMTQAQEKTFRTNVRNAMIYLAQVHLGPCEAFLEQEGGVHRAWYGRTWKKEGDGN